MSSGGTRFEPLAFVQRLLVVALLMVGIVLLHQYAVPGEGFDPRAMLALGFVILAAYTIGELATSVGIPHITGYLLSGVLFGPSLPAVARTFLPDLYLPPPFDQGVVSTGVIGQLGPIDAMALALIALSAGGELEVDELRRSLRYVLGSTVGMVLATIGAVFLAQLALVSVAPALVPGIGGRPLEALVATSLVVSILAAATSPAVAIAVVHSAGARGPVSSTVMSGVVLGEIVLVVLFSVGMTAALPALGTTGTVSVGESVAHVFASSALGLVAGAGIAAYLRLVGIDQLLFLVGAIFATTWLVGSFGGEPAVAFIAAGLIVGNAHRLVPAAGPDVGRTLLANVERMSRPVFAVFFSLAGAKLDLAVVASLAVPALFLFAVRVAAVRLGTSFGARISGAPEAVERFAWTGFVAQAGLAIVLASQARAILPGDVGDAVYSLVLALVSVGQIAGPSVLQVGLRRAGEIPENGRDTARPPPLRTLAADSGPRRPAAAWPAPEPAPWPIPPPLHDEVLDRALRGLDDEVQQLIEAEVTGPADGLRRDTETWVRVLRQQVGRHLRPGRWLRLQGADLASQIRTGLAEALDGSVEQLRSAGPERTALPTTHWVEHVDRLVSALPGTRTAPVADSFLAPRPERLPDRVRRALLRFGVRTWGTRRSVSLRDLGRWHLSGGVPAALEPAMALWPHARLHVADRVSEFYDRLVDAATRRADEADRGAPSEEVLAGLAADLRAVEAHGDLLARELRAIAADATERARAAAARLVDGLYADAERAGTFALSSRGPRYSPRFRERSRTQARLAQAAADAKTSVQSRYDELLLQLELHALRARCELVAAPEARRLEERFGRTVVAGLAQIDLDLERWIGMANGVIDEAATHDELGEHIAETWSEIRGHVGGAIGNLRQTAQLLTGGAWLDPLTEALLGGQHTVSAVHLLGVRAAPVDRHAMPPRPLVTSVQSSRRAAALVESQVIQPLRSLGEDLGAEVTEALAAATELERVTQFNVELARTELELLPGQDPPDAERREALRSMLVAAPQRVRARLRQRHEATITRAGTLPRAIRAILDVFGTLEDGLRQSHRDLATPAAWWQAVPAQAAGAWERLRHGVGDDRWLAAKAALGLARAPGGAQRLDRFRPPEAAIPVPPVYARLFSDLPFEAGELVAGRAGELQAVRAGLSTGLRSAAVVGIDPHGARAVVTAVLGPRRAPLWLDADGPAEPGTVARWLDPHADRHDQVFVVENLRWLFRRAPGGMGELTELTRRILRDEGRNQWILLADAGVWTFLAHTTALRDAMGAVVELSALTPRELERAIGSRHAMSGYSLEFTPQVDLLYRARRWLARGAEDERSHAAWFRSLHDASGGVLQDAMRLWLASILAVDDERERVVLGPVPRPPTAHLQGLDDAWLQTLLETRRQGWMDADSLQRLFRVDRETAASQLAQLLHLGLLVPHGPCTKIAPHLRGPVERVLAAKGWT